MGVVCPRRFTYAGPGSCGGVSAYLPEGIGRHCKLLVVMIYNRLCNNGNLVRFHNYCTVTIFFGEYWIKLSDAIIFGMFVVQCVYSVGLPRLNTTPNKGSGIRRAFPSPRTVH